MIKLLEQKQKNSKLTGRLCSQDWRSLDQEVAEACREFVHKADAPTEYFQIVQSNLEFD